jgi:hypothetical protein
MYVDQRKVQFSDLPLERVVLIPNVIPDIDRGEEADTVSMAGLRARRKDGPMIAAKWPVLHAVCTDDVADPTGACLGC